MATKDPDTREIRITVSKARYDWLRETAKNAGFNSPSRYIRGTLEQQLFEQLYLKGRFGRRNTDQIKGLVKVMKERRPTIQG